MRTEPTRTEYIPEIGAISTTLGPPETRPSIPVMDAVGPVLDRRLVVQTPADWYFNIRAVSEVYERDGEKVIDLVNEAKWYLHFCNQEPMVAETRAVDHVYLERATAEEVKKLGL